MDPNTPATAQTGVGSDHRRLHGRDHEHLHGPDHRHQTDHDHSPQPVDLVRIGLMALACLASWLGLWHYLAHFDVIALLATVAGGYPIFRQALTNLVAHRMTMELSMTLALAAALAIGEFFTALVIALFVLMAEVLEGLTVARGRGSIKDLLDLLPRNAIVRRGGATHDVGAAEVQVGEIVVIKPGARLPVDGVVIAGNSFVDQATITGESLPTEKLPGSRVFAGTIQFT
jgi:cation transport ATPase